MRSRATKALSLLFASAVVLLTACDTGRSEADPPPTLPEGDEAGVVTINAPSLSTSPVVLSGRCRTSLRSVAINAGTEADHAQFSVELVGSSATFPPGRIVAVLFTIAGKNYGIKGEQVVVSDATGSVGTVSAERVAPQDSAGEVPADVSIDWRCG